MYSHAFRCLSSRPSIGLDYCTASYLYACQLKCSRTTDACMATQCLPYLRSSLIATVIILPLTRSKSSQSGPTPPPASHRRSSLPSFLFFSFSRTILHQVNYKTVSTQYDHSTTKHPLPPCPLTHPQTPQIILDQTTKRYQYV